jgi:hypothetical protein
MAKIAAMKSPPLKAGSDAAIRATNNRGREDLESHMGLVA